MTNNVSIKFNQMQIRNTISKVINLNNDKIVTMIVIAGSVRYIIDIKISEIIHNIKELKNLISGKIFSNYCEFNHNEKRR